MLANSLALPLIDGLATRPVVPLDVPALPLVPVSYAEFQLSNAWTSVTLIASDGTAAGFEPLPLLPEPPVPEPLPELPLPDPELPVPEPVLPEPLPPLDPLPDPVPEPLPELPLPDPELPLPEPVLPEPVLPEPLPVVPAPVLPEPVLPAPALPAPVPDVPAVWLVIAEGVADPPQPLENTSATVAAKKKVALQRQGFIASPGNEMGAIVASGRVTALECCPQGSADPPAPGLSSNFLKALLRR